MGFNVPNTDEAEAEIKKGISTNEVTLALVTLVFMTSTRKILFFTKFVLLYPDISRDSMRQKSRLHNKRVCGKEYSSLIPENETWVP